jgi:hypothetical protein
MPARCIVRFLDALPLFGYVTIPILKPLASTIWFKGFEGEIRRVVVTHSSSTSK